MNTIKCQKNCGVELYFSDNITSKTGKKIPLEVEYKPEDVKHEYPQFNGKHHNCPNSNYGKTSSAPQEKQVSPPYKIRVLEPNAIAPINGKIDYILDLRHLVEERVKGTSHENNQAAIGQLLNLLIEKLNEKLVS